MTCCVGLLCYSSNHRNSCNYTISLDKCELIEGPNALISSPSLRPFFCPIQQSANSLIQFGAAGLELRSGAPPPPTLQRHSLGSRHSSFITAAHSPLRLLITSWGWDELSEILMRVSSLRGSRAAQDLARRSIRHPPSRVESLHDFCFSSCCLKVRPDDCALACANDIPVASIPCHQGCFFFDAFSKQTHGGQSFWRQMVLMKRSSNWIWAPPWNMFIIFIQKCGQNNPRFKI